MTCGRDNVSQAQTAFIVDQYLRRNQFFQTQATFRIEASPLFTNSPANENLLSLEEVLNQYIFMKKQIILLDKEKAMVIQEKNRIQMLLQDMQNVVNSFNAGSPLSHAATMITNSAFVPPMQNSNRNPPVASTGVVFPPQNTMLLPRKPVDNVNLSSPMNRVFDKKRKDTPTVYGSTVAKKPRGRPPGKKNKVQGINTLLPSPNNKVDSGFNSATTQSLVGNCGLRGSHISTNSVSRTNFVIHSFQCDANVSLPSDVSPPIEISPAATCNGEVINILLPSPNNKVYSGSNSATTHSLVGNCALGGSHISTNSVSITNSVIHSFQCDANVSLPSDVSPPAEISPAATSNGEVIAPCYTVIDTNRVMVEAVNQMVYKEDNHVISPIETHSDQTNKGNTNTASKRDTDDTSTRTLDNSFPNEIPTSESDIGLDDWARLDFSDIGLDDCSKLDFSFLLDDSLTKI